MMLVKKGGVRPGFVKSGLVVTKQLSPPRAAIKANPSEVRATRDKCLNLRHSRHMDRDNAVSLPGWSDIWCGGTGWYFIERLRKQVNKRPRLPLPAGTPQPRAATGRTAKR